MKIRLIGILLLLSSFVACAADDTDGLTYKDAIKMAQEKKMAIGILWTSKRYDKREYDYNRSDYVNSINDPYINFARKKMAYVRYNKGENLKELPEFLRTRMKSYSELQMPVLIFVDPAVTKVVGAVTHEDNYSNVQRSCQTILNNFKMDQIKEGIANDELKNAIEVVTTNHPIDAFDENNPAAKIGTFETGSKLVVDKRPKVPGYYSVCYTNSQNGTVIKALCQKSDFQ